MNSELQTSFLEDESHQCGTDTLENLLHNFNFYSYDKMYMKPDEKTSKFQHKTGSSIQHDTLNIIDS